ncbi:MAG: hypothetical protein GVX96_04025 [Bacteroidetes bacterium]|jgi:hypothetical protein|nr:hypothetical protein [Bacteroidota bacterium]
MKNADKKPTYWLLRLKTERVVRQMPLVYLLFILGLIYIFSVHAAERKLRKISNLENEVQETRWKYMSEKSKLMNSTTFSKIESQVSSMRLQSDGKPPIIIK